MNNRFGTNPSSLANRTRPKLSIRWGSLVRSILSFFLVMQAARLSLFLAGWSTPVKYSSLAALLIVLGLLIWGVAELRKWIRTLTIWRAITLIVVFYVLVVLITGLIAPGGQTFGKSVAQASIQVLKDTVQGVINAVMAVIRFPGQFCTAYAKQSGLTRVPGAEDLPKEPVIANDTSTVLEIRPVPGNSQVNAPEIGETRFITSQGAQSCQMDALADGPFAPGAHVQVVAGPQYIDAQTWWRVRSGTDSGWCPLNGLSRED